MRRIVGRFIYGNKSYYFAHLIIGIIIMLLICLFIHFVMKQPINIVFSLISTDIVELSVSLLGFQLAGVSILISLGENKKMSLLKKIGSDAMIYNVFISSITMFFISIVLMLTSIYFFQKIEVICTTIKIVINYCSIISFFFGIVFLFSSIRLLKQLCLK